MRKPFELKKKKKMGIEDDEYKYEPSIGKAREGRDQIGKDGKHRGRSICD